MNIGPSLDNTSKITVKLSPSKATFNGRSSDLKSILKNPMISTDYQALKNTSIYEGIPDPLT
jgi:hypothetical protein